ncbi:MAG: hypothetical protein KDI16_10815 [Halioglobus sp.]|nr:hypothetical protein [Halioglobus sp.]
MNQFLTHSNVGWYARRADEPPAADDLPAMCRATATCLNWDQRRGDRFQAASTCSQASLGRDGCVQLVGYPRFTDPELRQLAADNGPAAALACAYTADADAFTAQLWGAFSFSIVDADNERVVLGIDRLGQFPLFYHQLPQGIAWGTTANAVLAHPALRPRVSEQGVFDYVYFHFMPSPVSIFSGLSKLQAAHCLVFEAGKSSVQRYWQPQFSESTDKSYRDACDALLPLLRRAVQRSLDQAVAPGAFLSGGLDSSTVTGVLAEVKQQQAQAFAIGFSAKGYDEMPYARITARHFGVELNEYYVTPDDVVQALPLVATSYDEPFGNSSALPAYFCARMAAEHGVTRLLAGDGGDELFAGNERYARQQIFEHYARAPKVLRRGLLEPILGLLPARLPLIGKARSYIEQANVPLPDRLQTYNFLHRHAPEDIFAPDLLEHISVAAPVELLRSVYSAPREASTQNRMLYLDWQFTLADNDLRKVSHMCALAGVEVVYPLLDDELVAFSCTLPSRWKLRGRRLRHFYKDALQHWLPAATISKTKQGFGLPFGVWLQTHDALRELAYDNLLKLKSRHILRPEFIDRTIDLHRSGHAAYYGELAWILTVFELWMSAHQSANSAG